MIHQGHLYLIHGRKCIALAFGWIARFITVRDVPSISDLPEIVWASHLDAYPLPMKYHQGEVPSIQGDA